MCCDAVEPLALLPHRPVQSQREQAAVPQQVVPVVAVRHPDVGLVHLHQHHCGRVQLLVLMRLVLALGAPRRVRVRVRICVHVRPPAAAAAALPAAAAAAAAVAGAGALAGGAAPPAYERRGAARGAAH
jgi:hypothetical protein